MALHDRLDYWSPLATIVSLGLVAIIVFMQPPPLMMLSIALAAVVFAAGVLVSVRESIPSYNQLLGICCGIFGLTSLVSRGWSLPVGGMILIGVISILEITYEQVTGRSAKII